MRNLSLNSAHAQNLISESSKEAFTITGKRLPLAIIVEPVKELAEQVVIISQILNQQHNAGDEYASISSTYFLHIYFYK